MTSPHPSIPFKVRVTLDIVITPQARMDIHLAAKILLAGKKLGDTYKEVVEGVLEDEILTAIDRCTRQGERKGKEWLETGARVMAGVRVKV